MGDDEEFHQQEIAFLPGAWSALYSAAAREGLSYADVVNRAVTVYEVVISAKPGEVVSWTPAHADPASAERHDLLILPLSRWLFGGLLRLTFPVLRKAGPASKGKR